MASQYSVIQYVPDPVADERINIGVVVIGDDQARAQFIEDWRRVSSFGRENIQFLREFVMDVEAALENAQSNQLILSSRTGPPALNETVLCRMAENWVNSIQLTPLRGSLDAPDELLDFLAERFLRTPQPRERKYRDRGQAARILRDHVRSGLEKALGDRSSDLFRANEQIPGNASFHRLDAIVRNGRPLFAAHALSFENPSGDDLDVHLQLTLWAARDLRDRFDQFPFGVMILGSDEREQATLLATQSLRKVGAEVLNERDVEDWTIDRIAGLRRTQ